MKDFRGLKVWEKAHAMAITIYHITKDFPASELYGLTSQLRRSATSCPTNIAEGAGRGTDQDFKRFLDIAYASANELDYLLLLAKDLGYLDTKLLPTITTDIIEIKKMLRALIQKLIANR